jgi:DNA-binding NarL/FixJ family response regulator
MERPAQVALVADDDEFFRIALCAILVKRLGFTHVIETGSLDEALERLGSHKAVSLALFDLAMPGMQGAASLTAVRKYFPHVRVAVVSGSGRRGDILTALDTGVHGYVPKSLRVDAMTNALQLIIDGAIYVPPSLADPATVDAGTCTPPAEASIAPEKVRSMLTPRQQDVLRLLVQGKSNKEIAQALALSPATVKIHLAAVFQTLGVNTRAGAAVLGAKLLAA